jgi:tRNA dimethylallyltransferase
MRVPIITGPTACGKTDLSIALAEHLGGEIICLDSRQIYKYLDIGTAKPSTQDMEKVKHHLFGFVDPSISYSAYDYRNDALKCIKKILNSGLMPILVGGTGLYIDCLIKGVIEVGSDYGLRKHLMKMENESPGSLKKILFSIDSQSGERIAENDIKRTIRAIEIYILTGKKMSSLVNKNNAKSEFDFDIIVLDRDRKELYERIDKRIDDMLSQGMVMETSELISRYPESCNALNTLGYKQIIEYLKGRMGYEEAVNRIKFETHHYARRQIIYFRHFQNAKWINLSSKKNEEIKNELFDYIRRGN